MLNSRKMALAQSALIDTPAGIARPAPTPTFARDENDRDNARFADRNLLTKFFVAEAIFLFVAALHGTIQRTPWIADWLRQSDYGGHLITNLGLTHVNVVGGGTIAVSGLTYYVLPRVTGRPIYSAKLGHISFWLTVLGVFGFYMALIPIGLVEGSLVQQGYTYFQAKEILGGWHKAPEAVTAACMGCGYWIFVTNVWLTVLKGGTPQPGQPVQSIRDPRLGGGEGFQAKFHMVSATALLIGTLQGVYQVLPWSLDWLYKTGSAGQLIDPASHAHMNLVGGLVFAFMGFNYYLLPRILRRPIFSVRLANFSFWTLLVGVFSFWLVLIVLGFIEGDMVIARGITAYQAKKDMGALHSIPIACAATLMATGFWTFIANMFLTIFRKPALTFDKTIRATSESKVALDTFAAKIEREDHDASAFGESRYLAVFLGLSSIFLLISTIQGVLQVLPSTSLWIFQAREGGELVTPSAHAQLNIIGVITLTLVTLGTYVLPRVVGQHIYSVRLAKIYLTIIASGALALYLVFLTLGILEGNYIRDGHTYAQARQAITGGLHDWLFVAVYAYIGSGYLCYFYNIFATVGWDRVGGWFVGRVSGIGHWWRKMTAVNASAPSGK